MIPQKGLVTKILRVYEMVKAIFPDQIKNVIHVFLKMFNTFKNC